MMRTNNTVSSQQVIELTPESSSVFPTPASRQRVAGSMEGLRPRSMLAEAGASVRDSSLVQEGWSTLKGIGLPVWNGVKDVAATTMKASQQFRQPSLSSQPLQLALGSLGSTEGQAKAHDAAVSYGKSSAEWMDRCLPFAHSVLKVGLAGAGMTFGLGRSTGQASSDALSRLQQDRPQALGVYDAGSQAPTAAPSPSASPGVIASSYLTNLGAGSLIGAAGNLLGATLVAPVVDMMRQFKPIDVKAIVPDQLVNDLNTLVPGAGTKLREAASAAQAEVANVNSQSNVKLGQVAFASVTAARTASLGTTPLGLAGQVGFGLAVSSTAGAAVGAAIAVRKAVSTFTVPDMGAVRAAVVARSGQTDASPEADAATLEHLMKNGTSEVPLFYAHHVQPAAAPVARRGTDVEAGQATRDEADDSAQALSIGRVASAAGAALAAPFGAIGEAFSKGPFMDPQPKLEVQGDQRGAPQRSGLSRFGQTVSNLSAGVLRRATEMVKATAAQTAISAATNIIAKPMGDIPQRAALALGNSIGIHTVINPWFNALQETLPQGDKQAQAARQRVVNADALGMRPST